MKNRLRIALCVTVVVVLCPTRALLAWGAKGHHIVGRIALARMTPEAIAGVQELLGPDDFVASSTWADEIRRQRPDSYNWNFVYIPCWAATEDPGRDCRATARGDCIVAELERTLRSLSNRTLSNAQRQEALKFLIHFVGDLHQPLHTIDNHDRGGNGVQVVLAGRKTTGHSSLNLHTVWDTTLLSRGVSEAAFAASLIRDLDTRAAAPEPIDFKRWAEESHRVGVQFVYTYPGFALGQPGGTVVELSEEYQRTARAVVDRQLELAGERLAMILNQAFPGNR